jgi:TolA-binding protein
MQQQYEPALKSFQAVSGFPESRRLPDAMLKVAYCQYELKAFRNSRTTLQKVISTYPESDAARQAQARIEKMNAEGR